MALSRLVFTARRDSSTVYAIAMSVSLLSVCPSQVDVSQNR